MWYAAPVKVLIPAFFSVFILVSSVRAEDIRIVTPYVGTIRNEYQNQGVRLSDSSLMKGLFFQWVNPRRYQWNVFIYQSSDINYSTLWGGHLIFDYYIPGAGGNDFVLGAGFDFIRLDMDAGDQLSPVQTDFRLINNVYVLYVRFGRYFSIPGSKVRFRLLPWVGLEPQLVRGEVSFNMDPDGPGPAPPVPTEERIRTQDVYGIAGMNLHARILHFLELQGKYSGTFNQDDYFSTVSAMSNLYLSRSWALSYRFKYMETSVATNTYHIWGIAFVF